MILGQTQTLRLIEVEGLLEFLIQPNHFINRETEAQRCDLLKVTEAYDSSLMLSFFVILVTKAKGNSFWS